MGFIFDLDGTLVDSVYHHVLCWHQALLTYGIELSIWRIHRKIGMSGGLLSQALLRETGRVLDGSLLAQLQKLHVEAYRLRLGEIRPLPGSVQLLRHLTQEGIPWAIATSGVRETTLPLLERLGVDGSVPLVTREDVTHAKPDPDLFLEAARRIGIPPEEVVIVGDSVWDLLAARRARSLGVGVLSGGYGRDELERAGAFRVYEDPADLLRHLDELGVRVFS
ncbi:HAD family hydrolase [Candidatus Methylacidithermus pantelleriae]|uniref:HAD family hydrolase n=1 Tax=Candidatus Methylacidithermus pantelleriae TaxID=2744239 RepID=A0A8J2FNS9_9BACT|nr:HAD family hydrolase [Candidatus Methylacidithermus pantelleriae]CAF0697838.1 HAD family hydrolase [Candidatus Methylacidithermus pantelleriae]